MKFIKLGQAGETIIAVMMSSAILGLSISGAYVVARRSLNLGQEASERIQVLKMVETQIERLKYRTSTDFPGTGIFDETSPYCITDSLAISTDTRNSACIDGTFPDSELSMSIQYDSSGPDAGPYDDDTFTITAEWTRVASNAVDNVTIVYRIHPSL